MDEITATLRRIRPGPVVAVLTVLLFWSWSDSPSADTFVPDLMGLRVEVAQAAARDDGFNTEVVLKTAGGVPGTVIGQRPAEGAVLDRGQAITIDVTKGARQVQVPPVSGLSVDQARAALTAAKLAPGDVVYREEGRIQPDRVVTTDPPPKTTVDEGAKVDIIAAL